MRKVPLTQKQLICAKLLLTGATAKEIGEKLSLSHRTVEDHVEALKNKFLARNKNELLIKLAAVPNFQ
jgi:DNA-binding CsgD family transcriptional regulator